MRRILKEFDIIPDFLLECVSVSGIPRKHAHSLQRLHSLAFGCVTYYRGSRRPLSRPSRERLPFSPTVWAGFKASAGAKDQASLPLDGLLKDYPTPCFNELFGITERYALCSLRQAFYW
jgi:hypothetical protein